MDFSLKIAAVENRKNKELQDLQKAHLQRKKHKFLRNNDNNNDHYYYIMHMIIKYFYV